MNILEHFSALKEEMRDIQKGESISRVLQVYPRMLLEVMEEIVLAKIDFGNGISQS